MKRIGKELWKNKTLYLMALPLMAACFLFSYLPMPGIVVAFKDYNFRDGIWGSPWCGLDNFKFFFNSTSFKTITVNTLWINFNNIFWSTILAVLFAICLNEITNYKLKKIYQIFMFIPYFFSAIIVGRFVLMLFSNSYGLVNTVIKAFGGTPIEWYNSPQYWVKILVGTNLWKHLGYSVIIYI